MFIGLLLFVLVSGSADAPAKCPSDKIQAPIWLSRPGPQDYLKAYPKRAFERQLNGHSNMKCIADETGRLTKCTILDETPTGHGFGEAELKLAPSFRLAPKTADGCPNSGGVVLIPISWSTALAH